MIKEFWKAVVGYEGLYEVSDKGRVRSLPRKTTAGTILKPSKNHHGYLFVGLSKDGKEKSIVIHRLVAMAFIPNPNNLPCINHRDQCRTNNCVENLEWCTIQYNNEYGDRLKKLEKCFKPVVQLLDGVTITIYKNISEAARKTGLWPSSICACCKGKNQTAGGYEWKYTSE